jgi:hypothetical protein
MPSRKRISPRFRPNRRALALKDPAKRCALPSSRARNRAHSKQRSSSAATPRAAVFVARCPSRLPFSSINTCTSHMTDHRSTNARRWRRSRAAAGVHRPVHAWRAHQQPMLVPALLPVMHLAARACTDGGAVAQLQAPMVPVHQRPCVACALTAAVCALTAQCIVI